MVVRTKYYGIHFMMTIDKYATPGELAGTSLIRIDIQKLTEYKEW